MRKLYSIILLSVLSELTAPVGIADETLDTAPIISALIDAGKDAEEDVRYAAFNALNAQPRSDALLELFWRGLEDDSPRIRRLSLKRVVELEGPSENVLERLVSLAERKIVTVDDAEMQRQVESHLISVGSPAIPYLIEALKKDEVSYVAISALGQIPLGEYYTTVTTQLIALLKSETKSVRLVAVQSLHRIMFADAKAKAQAEATAQAKAKAEDRYLAYYTKLLQKYDSNGDGSLTKDEWSKMSNDPAAADADQDGKITAAELGKWMMRHRPRSN